MKRHLYSTSFYRKLTFLFRTGWTNVIRRQFGWIFFISSSFVGNALPAAASSGARRQERRWLSSFSLECKRRINLVWTKNLQSLNAKSTQSNESRKEERCDQGVIQQLRGPNFAIFDPPPSCVVGLYQTSRPVWKSGKFSKSGLSGNRTFSILDTRL